MLLSWSSHSQLREHFPLSPEVFSHLVLTWMPLLPAGVSAAQCGTSQLWWPGDLPAWLLGFVFSLNCFCYCVLFWAVL